MANLLQKVKQNLIIDFPDDDAFIKDQIAAAICYAEKYQNLSPGYYEQQGHAMLPSTERAVVMLASHWYESRDGSTGGFFGDSAQAGEQTMKAINNLLRLDRDWKV